MLATTHSQEDSSAANRELDALLEVVQPALFNSSLQIIGVVYTGCSEGVRVLAEVLSSRTYQIPLVCTLSLSSLFPFSLLSSPLILHADALMFAFLRWPWEATLSLFAHFSIQSSAYVPPLID